MPKGCEQLTLGLVVKALQCAPNRIGRHEGLGVVVVGNRRRLHEKILLLLMTPAFKYVLLAAVVIAIGWWTWRSTHSSWIAFPSVAPMYRSADYTVTSDAQHALQFLVGDGTARPGTVPADYVVRDPGGFVDYTAADGKPSW